MKHEDHENACQHILLASRRAVTKQLLNIDLSRKWAVKTPGFNIYRIMAKEKDFTWEDDLMTNSFQRQESHLKRYGMCSKVLFYLNPIIKD